MSSPYMAASKRDDWRSPGNALKPVRQTFGGVIGCDPCAPGNRRHWIAERNITKREDGLGARTIWTQRWYVNPPFSMLKRWAERAAAEGSLGKEGIFHMASRTDTVAFHFYMAQADAICFWRGRLKYEGAKDPAPFPVLFAYWGPHVERFVRAFEPYGMVRVNPLARELR